MKTYLILTAAACGLLLVACESQKQAEKDAAAAPTPEQILEKSPETHGALITSVEITTPLKQEWVTQGNGIYEMKCLACHKLTSEKVVGPGWEGVSKRRKPEWIMNMITNVDIMLAADEEAQKLLEQCLVRMPNQNLSKDEARAVLEFMRSNDGEK